ncbi:hypothetical protein DL96DRAFT_413285 [Flagelloscypha sp. PMI_526]|nr:hypothetical protein DL96DRAFT_413285 [Flagelloscypha sp. PMI_526]
MRKSQSNDLKSFFGTLVAHGNPRAQSQLGRNTVLSASRLDTSLNAAGTTFQLAKDASEVSKEVPYVKAVAGVLSQIIKIREEIQTNKERCGEIIDLVQLKSTTILQSLDKAYEAKGAEGFEDLKSDLEEYADFLQAVLREELEPFKTQPRWSSYINRAKNSGDLQRLERELNEFNNRFSVKRLVEISVALLYKTSPPARVIPQALPPSPKHVIGRDTVVDTVVRITLSSSEPRVVILGPGGIGKTTSATAVLHDSRITSVYPTIYFVSSELSPTIELLETRLADTLSIPQTERGTDLVSQIVDRIRQDPHPVLLCIDNLETVWEIEAERPRVDNFLESLSGAGSKLALVVTMRGTQAPNTSFPWNSTVLSGLTVDESVAMYEKLSDKLADGSAHELLIQLSGSPLAIKLFSRMVQEGDRPSQLLSSWNKHGIKALEIGGKHRLSSLERSIHLSVFSPRIDDTARLVLGLIALMPGGLSTLEPWFQGFESVLPDGTLLQSTLRALRRTALLDELGEPPRWQMLPPIRQFCLQFVDSTSSPVISLVELYVATVRENRDYASSRSQAIILPEMTNIRGLLLHGSSVLPLPRFLGTSTADYANWAKWQGIDESTILSSLLGLSIPSEEQAVLYEKLGALHCHWNRLDVAEVSLARALALYGETQNRSGEANTHESFGDLRMRQHQLEAAKASFARALTIYSETQDPWGEANTRQSIGILYLNQNQLDAAEASFSRALTLSGELQNRLGIANAHKSIGDIRIHQGQLDAAEASFTLALTLYNEIQNRMGEANTHQSMGSLRMRQDQLDAAESSLAHALTLHGKLQNRRGEAETYELFGDLRMRQARPEAAEASFDRALTFYGETHTRMGEANVHESFGKLHMLHDQLDAAEVSFGRALALYTETQYRLGEALTHQSIGTLRIRQDQLVAAEASFTRALTIFEGIQHRLGEATTHCFMGDLYLSQNRLDLAKISLNRALERYNETHLWGISACTFSLGTVSFRLHGLELAESAFSWALSFWEGEGFDWGIADACRAIGNLHLQRMQLDDAEKSLNRALDIYPTIVESRTDEALTNRSIGELHILRGQFEESERVFRRALDLDIAAQSRVGQGQSYRCLGKMFLKKGDFEAAESSYTDALRLFFEIEDYQATPCLLDLGKVWVQLGKVEEADSTEAALLRARWDTIYQEKGLESLDISE